MLCKRFFFLKNICAKIIHFESDTKHSKVTKTIIEHNWSDYHDCSGSVSKINKKKMRLKKKLCEINTVIGRWQRLSCNKNSTMLRLSRISHIHNNQCSAMLVTVTLRIWKYFIQFNNTKLLINKIVQYSRLRRLIH